MLFFFLSLLGVKKKEENLNESEFFFSLTRCLFHIACVSCPHFLSLSFPRSFSPLRVRFVQFWHVSSFSVCYLCSDVVSFFLASSESFVNICCCLASEQREGKRKNSCLFEFSSLSHPHFELLSLCHNFLTWLLGLFLGLILLDFSRHCCLGSRVSLLFFFAEGYCRGRGGGRRRENKNLSLSLSLVWSFEVPWMSQTFMFFYFFLYIQMCVCVFNE